MTPSGLTSYRAATLPPGYRLAKVQSTSEDNLDLVYVKGTGPDRIAVNPTREEALTSPAASGPAERSRAATMTGLPGRR